MKITDAIIRRLNEISARNNLTISKWSIKAGITPSTLYGVLSRKKGCPRIQTIKLLCDYVNMTLSEFFDTPYIKTAECDQER